MSGPQEQQPEGLEAKPSPSLCTNNCGFFSNPGCNGMCSMCYRKFMHSQPTKDPAPSSGATDLKVPSAMQEAPPVKSLHSHSPASPEHAPVQAAHSSLLTAAAKTPLDKSTPSPLGLSLIMPKVGDGSTPAQEMASVSQKVVEKEPRRPRKLRCFTCHKKVGPMGFSCRCGQQFCEVHRYPENHNCDFDHKAVERQKIQDDNPVVRSERVRKV